MSTSSHHSTTRRALISVTDKTGVAEFAKGLEALSFTILSTGGTAKILREHGVEVIDVSNVTGFPECFGGRVKTLHPKIHGGILADASNQDHVSDRQKFDIQSIDIVAVNLYNFAGEAKSKNLTLDKAIEFVDIGGPTMLRGAAKNFKHCMPVIDPADYDQVLQYWRTGEQSISLRQRLAAKVFATTASYDQMIANYFASLASSAFNLNLELVQPLRYGENSHQKANLYQFNESPRTGLLSAKILQGKELSYNNYVDLDAAAAMVADLSPLPAATIVKHTNPCGTAAGANLSAQALFAKALSSDPKCAFGGVVAFNIEVDESSARAIGELFLECLIAPGYTAAALSILGQRKSLRVLESNAVLASGRVTSSASLWKSISGGILQQTPDLLIPDPKQWTCASSSKPTPAMLEDLGFAMTICKHVKSNAIVLASNLQTIGIGAGQMSRVDSTQIAIDKARELAHVVRGSVLASDAFFPFRDTVDLAAKSGIAAIVQPGGSVRDQESVDAANEHGVVMMMTGIRHFKH